ncbi:MAG: LCP family protein [Bifidobacteriaceae bacterium]|jgi:LCP family protein required for cell wall assembly|nr:LCP family protein [Bifidobacteriaceae bacterium]
MVQPQHAAHPVAGVARHQLRVYRHRGLAVVASVCISLLLAGFTVVGEKVRQWNSNMDVIEGVNNLLTDRPTERSTTTGEAAPGDPFGGRAVDIAIIGSDSREGENASYSGDNPGSVLNDVNMIAHISADRTRVDVVAIPRDTLVSLPACTQADGTVSPEESSAAINSAFGKGSNFDPTNTREGVACVIAAIEETTGILLDGFILVDFAGFAGMVDGLGGVDICIPEHLVSKNTHLDLEAGLHHLDGRTALAYARTRKATADGVAIDGSDLNRINRQQQLIGAVIHEVLASGDLGSVPKLNRFATAVTESLTTSPELGSVQALAGLAYSLRNINLDRVSLMMAPVVSVPDGVHVRLAESAGERGYSAQDVFDALAQDEPMPGTTAWKLANPEPEPEPDPDTDGDTDTDADGTSSGGQTTPPAVSGPPTIATVTPEPEPDEGVVTGLNAPVTCEVSTWALDSSG